MGFSPRLLKGQCISRHIEGSKGLKVVLRDSLYILTRAKQDFVLFLSGKKKSARTSSRTGKPLSRKIKKKKGLY